MKTIDIYFQEIKVFEALWNEDWVSWKQTKIIFDEQIPHFPYTTADELLEYGLINWKRDYGFYFIPSITEITEIDVHVLNREEKADHSIITYQATIDNMAFQGLRNNPYLNYLEN